MLSRISRKASELPWQPNLDKNKLSEFFREQMGVAMATKVRQK